MNIKEEREFQKADKIVKEICAETGWSYLDSAKFLLAWCKEMANVNYDYTDKIKELEHEIEEKEINYGKIKKE